MSRKTSKIWLIVTILAAGFLLFYLRTWAPFMAIAGRSMEPELNLGDLVLIKQLSPKEIKEGDIIVFEVPSPVRELYNYPPIVAHRVVKINTKENVITFNTKGDNLGGPDPFTVRIVDLKGEVGRVIPYLGYLLLFCQSTQGLIAISIVLLLLTVDEYSKELNGVMRNAHKKIFAPVIEEQKETEKALNAFASAMAEYAQHLASHTKAVQDLAATTVALKRVVEQLEKSTRAQPESEKEKSG
jgi:signal peptidase